MCTNYNHPPVMESLWNVLIFVFVKYSGVLFIDGDYVVCSVRCLHWSSLIKPCCSVTPRNPAFPSILGHLHLSGYNIWTWTFVTLINRKSISLLLSRDVTMRREPVENWYKDVTNQISWDVKCIVLHRFSFHFSFVYPSEKYIYILKCILNNLFHAKYTKNKFSYLCTW